MATNIPQPVATAMNRLGQNVANWRKLQRLTIEVLASRANVSEGVVKRLERGASVSSESLFRVLRVLGVMDRVVDVADPYTTDVGKLRADEILPQRVRRN
jgi:transcriptional regulator with XRE-family HTH domain